MTSRGSARRRSSGWKRGGRVVQKNGTFEMSSLERVRTVVVVCIDGVKNFYELNGGALYCGNSNISIMDGNSNISIVWGIVVLLVLYGG